MYWLREIQNPANWHGEKRRRLIRRSGPFYALCTLLGLGLADYLGGRHAWGQMTYLIAWTVVAAGLLWYSTRIKVG